MTAAVPTRAQFMAELERIRAERARRKAAGEPCPHHGPDACCTECPDHEFTDGIGFPHPNEAEKKGRRALKRCRGCRELVGRGDYVNFLFGLPVFRCRRCAGLRVDVGKPRRAKRKGAR